jgi:hypothetical protein
MEQIENQVDLRSLVKKGILSAVLLIVWSWINFFMDTFSPLFTAKTALLQFENSDTAYMTASYGMRLFSWLGGLSTLILLALLAFIWWKPAKKYIATLVAIFVIGSTLFANTASAYYDKKDLTEIFYVRPNWTVFWVPDKGANLDSQGKMDSEEFYSRNRIPAKAFQIPHFLIKGSTGAMEYDYYGPSGRMFIVERTPYNRRWTASEKTGTSDKDQAIRVQTKQGLNVTIEATVSSMVSDSQGARYLFWWGLDMNPTLYKDEPNMTFSSKFYARPLADIMDSVVLGEAQRLIFKKVAKLTLDQANDNATQIMDSTFDDLKKFCDDRGITLISFGSAGTFHFDPDVQQALNDRYTAQVLAPYLEILQKKAMMDAINGNGWNHTLPKSLSLFMMPSSISDLLGNVAKGLAEAQKTLQVPAK